MTCVCIHCVDTCVRIDRQTYSVQESFNLQITLSLSLKASYDIGVTVHGIDHNASELCIVQCKYIYAMLWMLKFKVLDLMPRSHEHANLVWFGSARIGSLKFGV